MEHSNGDMGCVEMTITALRDGKPGFVPSEEQLSDLLAYAQNMGLNVTLKHASGSGVHSDFIEPVDRSGDLWEAIKKLDFEEK